MYGSSSFPYCKDWEANNETFNLKTSSKQTQKHTNLRCVLKVTFAKIWFATSHHFWCLHGEIKKGKVIAVSKWDKTNFEDLLQLLSTATEDKLKAPTIKMANKISCAICLKSMTKASDLARHLLCHSGEKLHKCAKCDKSFGRASTLKQHLLIHTGEKMHKCAQCDKSFAAASTLRKHLLTHSGEKVHKCAQCNKSFAEAGSVRKHLVTHTVQSLSRVKPHSCAQCNYSTTTPRALDIHILTHTGEKPHQCNHCGYSSTQFGNMKRHKMRNHSNEINLII